MTLRIFALPSLAIILAPLAGAQTPNKVGVIEIQVALTGTKDGQKAAAELQTRLGPKQREVERKRSEIQALQDKLNKSGDALAQAARDELTRTIDQKTKVYNRDAEDFQAEAQVEQQKVVEQLGRKITPIIDKFAAANGYSIILDVSNPNTPVLYASTAVNITKDIIDLCDKSAPPAKPATVGSTTPAPAKPGVAQTPAPAPVKKQP